MFTFDILTITSRDDRQTKGQSEYLALAHVQAQKGQ